MKQALCKIFFTISVLIALSALLFSCEKVKFKMDFTVDGEVYKSVNVTDGANTLMPKHPTKAAYIFAGWYNGDTEITQMPTDNTEDLILTAKWEPAYTFGLNSDNTYTITSYRGTETELSIPSEFEGITITAIGASAFSNLEYLEKVIIPDSITSIGDGAFYECLGLKSITIGNGVKSIGNNAFEGCLGLTRIEIPESVTSIGGSTFFRCYKLFEVYNLSTLDIRANKEMPHNTKNIYTPISGSRKVHTTEDGYIFYENEDTAYLIGYVGEDSKLNLPDTYNGKHYSIHDYAFYHCTELTSVAIPTGVYKIGAWAFHDCINLMSAILPSTIDQIGHNAFYGCYKLVEIYNLSEEKIESGQGNEGTLGYYTRDVYTSLDEPSKLHKTEEGCIFYEDNDTVYLIGYDGENSELTLPDTFNKKTYTFYNYAFSYNTKIANIIIPKTITAINKKSFLNCITLQSIIIPDSVNEIGENALDGCIGLTYITIPDSITTINNLFSGCTGLKSVTLGSGITEIGNNAFNGCSSLTEITIPDSVISIGREAFNGCTNLRNVVIPNGVTKIYDGAFSGCKELTDITLPESLKSIGTGAFFACKGFTEITIPKNVVLINSSAFMACSSLTSITFENDSRLESIGTAAFAYCESLPSITIPEGVTNIDVRTFSNCTNLTSVVIHSNITGIGGSAFNDCKKLTSITIPENVTKIGMWAFKNCENLSSITFTDTDTWYRTGSSNYTFGKEIDVTDASANATYFATNCEYYFYKS